MDWESNEISCGPIGLIWIGQLRSIVWASSGCNVGSVIWCTVEWVPPCVSLTLEVHCIVGDGWSTVVWCLPGHIYFGSVLHCPWNDWLRRHWVSNSTIGRQHWVEFGEVTMSKVIDCSDSHRQHFSISDMSVSQTCKDTHWVRASSAGNKCRVSWVAVSIMVYECSLVQYIVLIYICFGPTLGWNILKCELFTWFGGCYPYIVSK